MRDIDRIPSIIARLQRVWQRHPDLRLGQLILNVAESNDSARIYYASDLDLIVAIEGLYNSVQHKETPDA